MIEEKCLVVFVVLLSLFGYISSTELTFELADNARECFHENIVNKTKCTLEFQVRYFIHINKLFFS